MDQQLESAPSNAPVKRPASKVPTFVLLIAGVALLGGCCLVGFVVMSLSSRSGGAQTGNRGPIQPRDTSVPAGDAGQIQDAVASALGTSNREVDRIREVNFVPNSRTIIIYWAINDNFSQDMINTGAKLDIRDMLKAIRDSGVDYASIEMAGYFPVTGADGRVKELAVIQATYSRSTVDNIVFDNFLTDNVSVIADKYYVLPAFSPGP